MKKFNYLIAMAIAAFTFTSCEDVPEPFGQPINPNKEEIVVEPTGSGTEADPYNVAKVTEVTKAMADGDVKSDVYTKGFICQIDEIDTEGNYGNSTYWISDDAEGKSGKYEVYRGVGLGGQKFNEKGATIIKVGDAVIIKGNIKNFKGTTPEYDQGSIIVELNGQKAGGGGGDTPSGDVKTVSVSDFLAAKVNTSDWYQLTGTIKNLKDGDKYGNFDIEDATGSVYVYGLLAEKGGEKGKFQDLVAAKGIANGKKITIIGNRGEYNSSAQVANAYFVKIEDGEGGGGGDTPSGDGDGTEAKPYGVAAAIAAGSGSNVFVKAYIVGWIEGQTLSSGAHFDANATVASNILIADSPDETNVDKCMPVQLPSGAVRTAVNLQNNAGNYKKEIILVGNIEKYFGVPGIKGTSYAKIGDTEAGTKPSGGEGEGGGGGSASSTGTLDNPLTASQLYDIVAAMESGTTSTEDYYVKGKICSIKFEYSAQYGTATFNITDDGNTGSKEFTAYSTYYKASEQKWKEGDTQIAVGNEVVICGKVVNYNGDTPEFASKKSYVVTINSK